MLAKLSWHPRNHTLAHDSQITELFSESRIEVFGKGTLSIAGRRGT